MDEVRGLKREVKRLAYELQASLEALPLLRAMVDGSRDGVAIFDAEGGLLEHNKAFAAMVRGRGGTIGPEPAGSPIEDTSGACDTRERPHHAPVITRGTPAASLFEAVAGELPVWPPGDGPRIVSGWSSSCAPGSSGADQPGAPRGREALLEVLMTAPVESGRAVWIANVRELTDETLQARALAEARSRVADLTRALETQRRFEALFGHSPDALLLVDPAGRVLQRNTQAVAWWPHHETGSDARQAFPELAGPFDGLAPKTFERALQVANRLIFLDATAVAIDLADGTGVLLTARDTTAHRQAELDLQEALGRSNAALGEREVLLREIHHRVKNNLQVITSLLSIQADDAPEGVGRALEESAFRVRSMALVHELLYSGDDLAQLDFVRYLETLTHELAGALCPGSQLTFEADEVELPIDQAIPAGLIVNELLTNTFKHGRSADGLCRVTVGARKVADSVHVFVADQGPGFPGGESEMRPGSLGMTIARALAGQLGSALAFGSGPGAQVGLTFRVEHRQGG